MTYRDDHEALKEKAGDLERRLAKSEAEAARAKEDLRRAQDTDGRAAQIAKLTADMARVQGELDRMRGELDGLRGRPRRRSGAVVVPVAAVLALAAGGAATWIGMRREPPEVPRSGPPNSPLPAPAKAADAGSIPRSLSATWSARVTISERATVKPGDACLIRGTFEAYSPPMGPEPEGARARELEIRCGTELVFRQVEEGQATIHEAPGERPGTFRDTLEYYNNGDPEVNLTTPGGVATVFRGTGAAFRVVLAIDRSEVDIAGPPLFASSERRTVGVQPSREHKGKVARAEGKAPAKVGAECVVREGVDWADKEGNCELSIACGGERLYHRRARCPKSGPLRFTDIRSTRVDVDLGAGKTTVAEPDEGWSLEIDAR